MASKIEVLKEAALGKGCLGKAAVDEPVFVLRAQDKLAPVLVEEWASLAELHGTPPAKVIGARQLAREMRNWQKNNKAKYPD